MFLIYGQVAPRRSLPEPSAESIAKIPAPKRQAGAAQRQEQRSAVEDRLGNERQRPMPISIQVYIKIHDVRCLISYSNPSLGNICI